ncbi:unnamed protein product [Brassica rapa subsp. trilocularis]
MVFFFCFDSFCRKRCEFTTMVVTDAEGPLLGEITCGILLQKLQIYGPILQEAGQGRGSR